MAALLLNHHTGMGQFWAIYTAILAGGMGRACAILIYLLLICGESGRTPCLS